MEIKLKNYDAILFGFNKTIVKESDIKDQQCLNFNQAIFNFAKSISSSKKIAIVTMNNQAFSDYVIPQYNLDEIFRSIINSHYFGIDDITECCSIALQDLNNISEDRALLITSESEHCEAFNDFGGQSYLFQGDEQFCQDFGIDGKG